MNETQFELGTYHFYSIGSADEVKPGERLFVEIGDRPIVLLNIAGSLYALGDVCTHDGGPLGDGELEGFEIICPRHGARFDIRSGEVLSLPAVENAPAYPVKIVDGQIQIGVPAD